MEILSVKPEGCMALVEQTVLESNWPGSHRTLQYTIYCEAGTVQFETLGNGYSTQGFESAGRICARMCVSCPSRPHTTQAIGR
jgi:hypothetical protein